MGRASDIEAFARLLDGAPASSVSPSVAGLGHTVAALRGIPAPALPAGLANGGLALLTRSTAATHVVPHGTQIAGAHGAAASKAGASTAKAGAAASKLAATKAAVFGAFAAHLVPVVAGTAVLAVGVTGVAVCASRSLPGDPLYGLRRATESVQTATVTTRVGLAERHLDLATTRLHEALALQADGGSASHLNTELHQWLTNESTAMTVLAPLAATPAVQAALTAFVAADGTALSAFPAALVAPVRTAIAEIATLLATPLPVRLPAVGATAKPYPLTAPSTGSKPLIPAGHASLPVPLRLPSALPSVVAKLPATLPSALPSAPVGGLPSVLAAIPSALPTQLVPTGLVPPGLIPSGLVPSSLLPSGLLPTALPKLPLPAASDVTTLLQGLVPKH